MATSSNLLSLLVSLAVLLPSIRCDTNPDMAIHLCEVYNKNQQSPTDADKMMANLINLAPNTGFAYSKDDPNVYGFAWCIGDFSPQSCSTCLTNAAQRLLTACSHQTTASRIVFQDFCFIRIATEDFLQTSDFLFGRFMVDNSQQVQQPNQKAFEDSVVGMIQGLKQQILQQGNNKKFARGQANFDAENSVIQGMVNCADGLSAQRCETCVNKAIDHVTSPAFGCRDSRYCEVLIGAGCVVQYNARK